MERVRRWVRSVRFWAVTMVAAAGITMLVSSNAEASCGPCGAGACMGPTGCVSQYSCFCYYNTYLCCYFTGSCAQLVQSGYCGP